MKVKSESEVIQSYPTLSDPMDCSLPGSSVHGIFQARVLEWVAIVFSDQGWSLSHCTVRKGPALVFFEKISIDVREGNGTPLQYSCLENPTDGGA